MPRWRWPAQEGGRSSIGGALSLTGIQAPLDTPGFKGAQVAVKYLNDNGGILGKPVEFINIDGKSDPVTVGNVTVELIDDGADLILAPCDFDFGGPASREAQDAGLVGISTCASDPLYRSWSLGDKQFTLSMWNTTMGAVAADFACEEKGWKNAYVVTDQFIAYTKSLSKYFMEHYEDDRLRGPARGHLHQRRQRLLGAALAPAGAGREAGRHLPVLLRAGHRRHHPRAARGRLSMRRSSAATPTTIRRCIAALGSRSSATTSTSSPTPGWARTRTPRWRPSSKIYEDLHGEAPDTSFVATGWDTVMLLAQAVETAGTTDGEAVAKALEEGEFNLLTGDLSYASAEEGHVPNKAAVLVELVDGKPQFMGWRRPETIPAP